MKSLWAITPQNQKEPSLMIRKRGLPIVSTRRFLRTVFRLKWLGMLGLLMFFSNWPVWKYFYIFWLTGILEIVVTFPVFFQILRQMLGIIKAENKQKTRSTDFLGSTCKYSLPFEGEWTVVNGGVSKEYSHSWDINSQRYAYDFVILDNEGRSYLGCQFDLHSYYCYEKDILAPGDGVVSCIGNSSKDSMVLGNGMTDPLINDLRGNYIIIKHDEFEYSLLAHLKPDSILVEVGQHIKRGEKIACCGNSGNTTEPHLHFQLQTEENWYDAIGVPISFEDVLVKAQENYEKFDIRSVPAIERDRKSVV